MAIAQVSSDGAGLFGAVIVLQLAALTAMWRLGTILSGLRSDARGLARRVDRLEEHEDTHSAWHASQGGYGVPATTERHRST